MRPARTTLAAFASLLSLAATAHAAPVPRIDSVVNTGHGTAQAVVVVDGLDGPLESVIVTAVSPSSARTGFSSDSSSPDRRVELTGLESATTYVLEAAAWVGGRKVTGPRRDITTIPAAVGAPVATEAPHVSFTYKRLPHPSAMFPRYAMVTCAGAALQGASGILTVHWFRDGVPIHVTSAPRVSSGPDTLNEIVIEEDRGHALSCEVVGVNASGTTTTARSASYAVAPDLLLRRYDEPGFPVRDTPRSQAVPEATFESQSLDAPSDAFVSARLTVRKRFVTVRGRVVDGEVCRGWPVAAAVATPNRFPLVTRRTTLRADCTFTVRLPRVRGGAKVIVWSPGATTATRRLRSG